MIWRDREERIPKHKYKYDDEIQLEILRDMLINLPDIYDKSVGSFAFDMLSPSSIVMAGLYQQGKETSDKLYVKNRKGKELDISVYELTGLVRKEATKASGDVVLKGRSGAFIERGSLVASDKVRFTTLEDVELDDDGQAVCEVECVEYGVVGNVGPKMIRYFPVTIPGVETVYNPEAFDNGYEEESDESLYQRYIEYLQTPTTSGNKYHYIQWAKEVEGVGGAKVQGAEEVGPGNVNVIIIDRNQNVASDELIEATYEYIETQRPIGPKVTVTTGKPKNINIEAQVVIEDGFFISGILEKFEQQLEIYRQQVAFKHSYISQAKIIQILLDIDGVIDVRALKLNGEMSNISLDEYDIPSFGEINIYLSTDI